MSKSRSKKQKSLFEASEVAKQLQDAINRDLAPNYEDFSLDCKDPIRHAKARQSMEFLKKFDHGKALKAQLELEAFLRFEENNQRLAAVDLNLPPLQVTSDTSKRDLILLRARALMYQVLGDFDETKWFARCKNSGGASVGVSFVDTSPEKKLSFPISVTAGAKTHLLRYFLWDYQLAQEVCRHNTDTSHGTDWNGAEVVTIVVGSQATTVNKTAEVRRVISKEPTGNMYLQQGLMLMMYELMEAVELPVSSLPDMHQLLARVASITGRDATIDLKDASSSVLYELVEWFTPRDWFAVLCDTRSDFTVINGRRISLNMFATMGNAVTFPLETLIFWTIAVAAEYTMTTDSRSMFLPWNFKTSTSVFGDDCIVPGPTASIFMEVLVSVGFIVNSEKSFYGTERFRESCGGDYLAGYNVRPFNLRAPTSERISALEPWLYTVLNAMIPRYISYFGSLRYVYKRELFRTVFDLLSKHGFKLKIVPNHYPDDSGIKLGFDLDRFLSWYEAIELAPLYHSPHGLYSFLYCRFVYYNNEVATNQGLRYCMWLKKPVQPDRLTDPWYKERRIGGYVVARGYTGQWSVPSGSSILKVALAEPDTHAPQPKPAEKLA